MSLTGWLGVNADFFKDLITLKDQVFYFIGYDMTSSARDGTKASVLTYHRIIEAFKFGFAWRSRLGDPEFNKNKNIDKVSERLLYSRGVLPYKSDGGARRKRGTNSTTTNYITGTANANRIYFKKYSDTCLPLWWNESIGRKIIKEFCKKVHWQTLAAVILGFSTLSFINPQI